MRRASITTIEAAVGVVLLVGVAFVFVLAVPGGEAARTQAQLDAYAEDGATLLAGEQPRHAEQTRLAEATASRSAFERERAALARRVEEILPPNVLYRLETEHGAVGHPLPEGVRTGTATRSTVNGEVTLTVWYA
jgi:hypothetical protein